MSLTQLHPVYLEQALSICHLSSCGIVFRLVDIDASQKERLRWQYKWRRGWLYRQKCLGILIHIIPWFWTCVIHFLVYIWWPDAFALRLFVLIRCIELPVQFCLICIFSMRVQCEVTEEHMFLCNVRKVNGRAQDCAFISVGYQTMENLYQNWLFFLQQGVYLYIKHASWLSQPLEISGNIWKRYSVNVTSIIFASY